MISDLRDMFIHVSSSFDSHCAAYRGALSTDSTVIMVSRTYPLDKGPELILHADTGTAQGSEVRTHEKSKRFLLATAMQRVKPRHWSEQLLDPKLCDNGHLIV
jgi:hypothetical protein